tara:strand:- start:347 stop:484 length:138 start_codon:yes stop_codon:yes gene_type:complete
MWGQLSILNVEKVIINLYVIRRIVKDIMDININSLEIMVDLKIGL